MLGIGEILVLVAAIVIFFSAKRLPDAARGLKKSMKSFKGALNGEDEERPVKDVTPKPSVGKGSDPDSGK